MKKQTSLLIFLMFFAAVVTACSGEVKTTSEIAPEQGPTIDEVEVLPTIDICAPLDIPDIAFPRQEPMEGPREVMEAELVGDLVVSNGCLRVESLYTDGSYLPLWPPEFRLGLEDGIPVLLNGDGQVVTRVGDEIYMGGGEGSEKTMPECLRKQLPADCGGPFWVVGDGVRPNLRQDSELIQLEVITTTERTAILIHKKTVLDGWIEEPSTLGGILRLYTPQRCPRIQSESGAMDYLPIWPPGYSLQIQEGVVVVFNTAGELIAREGEAAVLRGGAVPHSWESEQYRQLYYHVPGDCFGPYWIVSEQGDPK